MKKIYLILFIFLLVQESFAQNKNKILEVEVETPIVISLSNKQDGGEWSIEKEIEGLELTEKRKGYLYTYFIFKSYKILEGTLIFKYKKSGSKETQSDFTSDIKKIENNEDTRIYSIKVIPKSASSVISSLEKQGIESEKEKPLVVSEKDKKTIEKPNQIKLFIEDLIDENLLDEAFNEVSRIEENQENSSIEKQWLIQKKIEILEKQNKFEQILTYINTVQENSQEEKKISSSDDIFIRLKKANALYRLGKKNETNTELIFLKNYYPDEPSVYFELGNFYFNEGLLQKGVSMFEFLLAKFDELSFKEDIYYKLAKYYYQTIGLNGYNLSYKYYKKLLVFGHISPYYPEAKKMTEFLEKSFINIR
ncbi:MAG TPA: hypothetical protein DHW82_03885 [Spirochaetia bacterium]|nr:MAG: hypothetical protein A2Y41_08980 [Spirochaetes bacterium GWB1_36_13]HCL56134.1 hypothetical protein [Spirochaetia bacterium]